MLAEATITELCLMGGLRSAHIECEMGMVPTPGRYVLAHLEGSEVPLATELFAAEYHPNGFIAAPPVPGGWRPGSVLDLRGPLGKGFELPPGCRHVALIAFNNDPSRLLPLVAAATRQDASVAMVCGAPPSDLPFQLEIHPPELMSDVCAWSDYAAFDVERGSVPALVNALRADGNILTGGGQVLVRAPMPCGGLAECGVCTVRTARGTQLTCIDGPVFDLGLLILER